MKPLFDGSENIQTPDDLTYRDGLPVYIGAVVYILFNLVNEKVYVGSAIKCRPRLHVHRSSLRNGCHDNSYLQNAWNKYGEENFMFVVVEFCEESQVDVREQYWIDTLEATNRSKGYNLALYANKGPMTGRTHSPETRKKLSAANAGKDMSRLTKLAAEANRGRSREFTEDHKQNIAEARKRFYANLTDEQREKLNSSHPIYGPNAEQWRQNMIASLTGRKLSEEHKKKIGDGCRGRKRTEEQKANYRAGHWSTKMTPEEASEVQRQRAAKGWETRRRNLELKQQQEIQTPTLSLFD